MLETSDILNHAKSAVDRTTRSLSEMRARLQTAALNRQHRVIVEEAMHDLARRHELLVNLYEDMLEVPASELPMHWKRFFIYYDAYLEAVRDTKCRLVREVE